MWNFLKQLLLNLSWKLNLTNHQWNFANRQLPMENLMKAPIISRSNMDVSNQFEGSLEKNEDISSHRHGESVRNVQVSLRCLTLWSITWVTTILSWTQSTARRTKREPNSNRSNNEIISIDSKLVEILLFNRLIMSMTNFSKVGILLLTTENKKENWQLCKNSR